MKFNKEQKEAIAWVLNSAIKLGTTLGNWLDTDQKFQNRAAFDALDAMKPHFVSEIESRFDDIEREEAGYCWHCNQKIKDTPHA